MSAYRKVSLAIFEVRPTDFLMLDGKHYQLLNWQRVSEIGDVSLISGAQRLKSSTKAVMRLQAWNMNTDSALPNQPISVLLNDTSTKLDALVEVPSRAFGGRAPSAAASE